MIEKFDAAGDNLISLIKYNSDSEKKYFINVFFANMLIWGSYKMGSGYATDKVVIYRTVSVI